MRQCDSGNSGTVRRLAAVGLPLSVFPPTAIEYFLSPLRRIPRSFTLFRTTMRAGRQSRNADFILIAPGRYHHPLNPLNLLNPHALPGVSKGPPAAAPLSYPHSVQNSVNSCGNSQKISPKSQALSTKLITEIHTMVIHNL